MSQLLMFLFINLIFLKSLIGQINTTNLDFDNLNKKIELHQDDLGELQSLIIKNSSGDLIKTISIDKEFDPYHFKDYYQGVRNFAIIGGRYKFFIINVSNNKLIGPYTACCRVESVDSQTGVLYAYRITQDGQYLLVNALDNGLTCYSLLDLYNPKEVDFLKSDSIYSEGKYFFIDKRKENLFNGITAECGNFNTKIDYNILFNGYKLCLDSLQNLQYKIIDNNTLILKQKIADSNIKDLFIDLDKGEIINRKD